MPTDLDIARAARLRPIREIAAAAGIPDEALEPYGRLAAKIALGFAAEASAKPHGRLVLVTGISPTPAGEGKTTTTIGLADALAAAGRRAMVCLREPSLGPCFGIKGGATGGGQAQVAPMARINLHFTGDFHAITSANNLLAALLDNHLHRGNALGIDPRRVSWRRCLDMNDRALRDLALGLGGNGPVRQDGFDITVASEVMAVFCLARDATDLQARLARMVVARRADDSPVTAADLDAAGAMTALLIDALAPNLVQTLAGTPALVHGGPFANIAHGCNSVMATRLALGLADIVVTEAGFGADLGAEKFLDIKCRSAGVWPSAAVIVATVRALKMHGGVTRADLSQPDAAAVRAGCVNLRRHVRNMQGFGLPVVVALNAFDGDSPAEAATVREATADLGVEVIDCRHWAEGAPGAAALAEAVAALIAKPAPAAAPLYPDALPLAEKLRRIAQRIYGAADIELPAAVARRLAGFEAEGHGGLPVCIAKTQYSFSADPARLGAPEGHVLPVREVRLSAGAGFVVAICGAVNTMPGLPRAPAAARIGVDADGLIEGLS